MPSAPQCPAPTTTIWDGGVDIFTPAGGVVGATIRAAGIQTSARPIPSVNWVPWCGPNTGPVVPHCKPRDVCPGRLVSFRCTVSHRSPLMMPRRRDCRASIDHKSFPGRVTSPGFFGAPDRATVLQARIGLAPRPALGSLDLDDKEGTGDPSAKPALFLARQTVANIVLGCSRRIREHHRSLRLAPFCEPPISAMSL